MVLVVVHASLLAVTVLVMLPLAVTLLAVTVLVMLPLTVTLVAAWAAVPLVQAVVDDVAVGNRRLGAAGQFL